MSLAGLPFSFTFTFNVLLELFIPVYPSTVSCTFYTFFSFHSIQFFFRFPSVLLVYFVPSSLLFYWPYLLSNPFVISFLFYSLPPSFLIFLSFSLFLLSYLSPLFLPLFPYAFIFPFPCLLLTFLLPPSFLVLSPLSPSVSLRCAQTQLQGCQILAPLRQCMVQYGAAPRDLVAMCQAAQHWI